MAEPAAASCGAAFCTVNTGWGAWGAVPTRGWTFDLRSEFLKQDVLRAGDKDVGPARIPDTHDELRSLNRNLLATVAYAWDFPWAVTLQIPYSNRAHTHIFNDPSAGPVVESWYISAPSDVRVIGVYQFSPAPRDDVVTGMRFGPKLPTGSTEERNADGERAERTLQPGTGSTDLILGAYRNGHWAHGTVPWFAQVQWQQVLIEDADFRPGSQINFDVGLSRRVSASVDLLLQFNSHWRTRNRGAEAEPENSGSRALALSPGLAVNVATGGRVYGFVQMPFYQYVNGAQLTSRWSAVLGWWQRF